MQTIQSVTPSHNAVAAFEYARHGLRVIPSCSPWRGRCNHHGSNCTSPGKVPLIRWATYQSRPPTENEMTAWWKFWPTANLSVVCGYPLAPGNFFTIVDIEEAGVAKFWSTCPPATPMYASQGRGVHLWFLSKQPIRARRIELDGHFLGDLRGYGSLATVPPSVGLQGWYQWRDDYVFGRVPIAPLPDWLARAPVKTVEGDRYNLETHGLRILKDPHPAVNALDSRVRELLYSDSYRLIDRSRFDAKVAAQLVAKGFDDQTIQDIFLHPSTSKAREKLHTSGPAACKEYIRRTIAWARRTARPQAQG